ncbi:MAG: fibronectin type III domain-containing protein [Saprospiraceae bacterium]|nr:fibronectin type III domain-containing protein [Saprospiraceae bacterium]
MKIFLLPRPFTLLFSLLLFFPPLQTVAQKKCPKVTDLKADQITDYSAQLSWTGADEHTVFQISVKHGNGTSPFKYDLETDATSMTVDDLQPGSAYRFQIKAKCDQGSSGSSGWFDFETTGDAASENDSTGQPGKCPKASNLAVIDVTDTTATLTWLGNPENTSYRVDVHQKEHTPQYKRSEVVDTTFLEVEGLEPGGNYKFRVKSECEKNAGGSSSWINFTTTGGDSTFNQCPKPTNLSVLAVTDSSALLTWIARDSVTKFTLEVKSFEQTPSFSYTEMLEDTFKLVEGLAADGNYQFRVVATCLDGSTSGSSDWSKFRTLMREDTSETEQGTMEEQDTTTNTTAPLVTFPNPVGETLNVDLPAEELGYITYILLSDINGRVVYSTIVEGVLKVNQATIPMQDLPDGLYKLQVRSVDYLETKTILVHH